MTEVDGTQAERKLGDILQAAEKAPASRVTSKTLVSNQAATPTDIPPFNAPIHPAAAIIPEQSATEYAALFQDIDRNGVLNPVWFDREGRVLDGRHRLRAAHQLGIGCPTAVYDGPDPIDFVLSQNLHRRHLTTSQRAIVAAKMVNLREGRPSKNTVQNCTVSTEQAAATFRVSTRTIRSATTVLKHGSQELVRAVEMGKISVGRAAALVTAATNESQPIEETELSSHPDANHRTPPAIANLPQGATGVPNRRGSLRGIAMFVVRILALSRAYERHGARILNPRIAAKLTAIPADERQRWITTVHDAREMLGRFEQQLQQAFETAPAVTPASATAASGSDGDAPHDDREEHHDD